MNAWSCVRRSPSGLPARALRPGFTLVEMLVVITIIGILAGLVGYAAQAAYNYSKNVRIKAEVDQLDAAIKAFKQQYGAYPPCDLRMGATAGQYPNQNALMAFLMQAFPRYINNGNPAQIQVDLHNAGVDTANFRPDAALVFWLQGFNPDGTQPFGAATTPGQQATSTSQVSQGIATYNAIGYTSGATLPGFTPKNMTVTPLFVFDQTRLSLTAVNGTYAFVYTPINQTAPYVYFDMNTYGSLGGAFSSTAASGAYNASSGTPDPSEYWVTNSDGSAGGVASPYVLDVNNNGTFATPPDTFCNPTSFQIISAGQDNQFGFTASSLPTTWRLFPSGAGYDLASGNELDNVTNFNPKATLNDALP